MRYLVAGLINLETTLRVEEFPISYEPVRFPFFGVHSTVSGVGFNVAKALRTLGNDVQLLSMLGDDPAGSLVRSVLADVALDADSILNHLQETPQSVILYDAGGRRQINVDLKDIQDIAYPVDAFLTVMNRCDWLVIGNIDFARPFLSLAVASGKPIATDVHTIDDLDDPYNQDYMAAATILFMSDEMLPTSSGDWARAMMRRYGPEIVVIGLGSDGALLAERTTRRLTWYPAVRTREVVNTIGAGDALFTAFIHDYALHGDPDRALRRAQVFASYKIGVTGAGDGFLDREGLEKLMRIFEDDTSWHPKHFEAW